MRFVTRAAVLGCLFAALLCAQTMKLSVSQLRGFLRSSIQLNHPDKQVADYVKKIQLTERLTERDIEELLGEGLGPRTAEALRALAAATVAMPAAGADPVARAKSDEPTMPIPPEAEQKRIIEEARQISLSYSKSLPDFICLQVTRRYFDPNGLEYYRLADTVAARLSYFEQKEDYKVISVNNQVVNTELEKLGGTTSRGEFGSQLKDLFEAGTQAEFWWERWAKLRGRIVHVFGYRVQQPRSKMTVGWQNTLSITVGYKGLIYIDRDVPTVMRLTFEAENMPPTFPIQEVRNTLDYDYTDISGNTFLLPMRSEMKMRESKLLFRNLTEFRNYRKFGADTTITFDIPDELPAEKTQEEPVKEPIKKE